MTQMWKVVLTGLLLVLVFAPAVFAADVPRMEVDTLLEEIDSPDVVIVDVRSAWDWKKTEGMVRNAIRHDPGKAGAWMNELDKEKTIVLYCA